MRVRLAALLGTALASVLFVPLIVSGRAGATAPVTTRMTTKYNLVQDCPDFQIDFRQVIDETVLRFLDTNGVTVRQETIIHDAATFTNTSTAKSYSAIWSWSLTFRPEVTVSVSGVIFRLAIPGQGLVAIDAGRIIYDWATGSTIFDKGPTDRYPNLCAVLL